MTSPEAGIPPNQSELLAQIMSTLQSIQRDYRHLPAAVDRIQGQVNVLAGIKQVRDAANTQQVLVNSIAPIPLPIPSGRGSSGAVQDHTGHPESPRTSESISQHDAPVPVLSFPSRPKQSIIASRIILTTYPGQSGVDPLIMNWGHPDPLQRGPVVVTRNQSTIRRRNGK